MDESDLALAIHSFPEENPKCARCGGYMHPYVASCFGCGWERGSAFAAILRKELALRAIPGTSLLEHPDIRPLLAERGVGDGSNDDEIHEALWRFVRVGDFRPWKEGQSPERVRYLGGLEWAPTACNASFYFDSGSFVLWPDGGTGPLAAFTPDRLMGVFAKPSLDPVLGGRSYGLFVGNVAIFDSFEPTEGGALSMVFADASGVWRLAAIGNRTGVLDKRMPFRYWQLEAELFTVFCRHFVAGAEWRAGVRPYASDLSFQLRVEESPSAQRIADMKVCPDCAETVRSEARICRFCRHEFFV